MAPRISVVVPCYDDGATVGDAVASVREAEPVEIVVVDDGSRDPSTIAVLDELAGAGTVRLLRQANAGVSAALRAGTAAATAPYVFVLNSDDLVEAGSLAALADALDRDPAAAFAFGWVRFFGDLDALVRQPPWNPWILLHANRWTISSLYRREALDRVGGFVDSEGYEDWDLLLALAAQDLGGVLVPRVVLHYRQHGAERRNRGAMTSLPRHYAALRQRHAALFAREPELRRRYPLPFRTRLAYRAQLRARARPAGLAGAAPAGPQAGGCAPGSRAEPAAGAATARHARVEDPGRTAGRHPVDRGVRPAGRPHHQRAVGRRGELRAAQRAVADADRPRPFLVQHPLDALGQRGVAVAAAEHQVAIRALGESPRPGARSPRRSTTASTSAKSGRTAQVVDLRLQHAVVAALDQDLRRLRGSGLQVARPDRPERRAVPAGRLRGVEVVEGQRRALDQQRAARARQLAAAVDRAGAALAAEHGAGRGDEGEPAVAEDRVAAGRSRRRRAGPPRAPPAPAPRRLGA